MHNSNKCNGFPPVRALDSMFGQLAEGVKEGEDDTPALSLDT